MTVETETPRSYASAAMPPDAFMRGPQGPPTTRGFRPGTPLGGRVRVDSSWVSVSCVFIYRVWQFPRLAQPSLVLSDPTPTSSHVRADGTLLVSDMGEDGPDYLSPMGDKSKVEALLTKYMAV